MSEAPVSCVISTWNKRDFVRANLLALQQQTMLPREVVVVDNHSHDGTAEMIQSDFPDVILIKMPHSEAGACETFNLGFKKATSEFVAILDDDVVLPPNWIERMLDRIRREPDSTALVTSQIIEPNMPDSYLLREDMRREAYLCTFRGCGSLVRRAVLEAAGYYDEKFFIYGNERDLAARILNLGYRILLDPTIATFHGTPFGMKAGKRSLYYHVRNFWLYAFKHCAWRDVFAAASKLSSRALGFGRGTPAAAEATGTIGLEKSLTATPGGTWIALKASLAAVALLPYCLRHRRVCRAPDFRPPLS